jgi:ATP-dependent RNA helicase DDX55/SPB4
MSEGLGRLVKAGLRNPVKVTVKVQIDGNEIKEQRIPETLTVKCLVCKPEEKIGHLLKLWDLYKDKKFIVYFANGASVDFFFKYLCSISKRFFTV